MFVQLLNEWVRPGPQVHGTLGAKGMALARSPALPSAVSQAASLECGSPAGWKRGLSTPRARPSLQSTEQAHSSQMRNQSQIPHYPVWNLEQVIWFLCAWVSSSVKHKCNTCLTGLVKIEGTSYVCKPQWLLSQWHICYPFLPSSRPFQTWLMPTKRLMPGQKTAQFSLGLTCVHENIHLL